MAKQRMIVTDDQLLIDTTLLFNAIRDSGGKWEDVETELYSYKDAVSSMSQGTTPAATDEPLQRMTVTDDQLIVDSGLVFNAIREADGKWEQVELEMQAYLDSVRGMAGKA
ncbi:hypothetical protein KA012_04320 [Candidatus Woesebacteria bacterium]|nr:hypothetical protein [Candidatus Woesebacteria bacterium]